MPVVRAETVVPVPLGLAHRLWTDTNRWPTFIDGFGHIIEQDPSWPEQGAKVVWQSGPAGRGRVTERVTEHGETSFATQMFEERMAGTQRATFEADPDGTAVILELDYTLAKQSPLTGLTDFLFIRRPITMALERTLERFSREAAEEAAL